IQPPAPGVRVADQAALLDAVGIEVALAGGPDRGERLAPRTHRDAALAAAPLRPRRAQSVVRVEAIAFRIVDRTRSPRPVAITAAGRLQDRATLFRIET